MDEALAALFGLAAGAAGGLLGVGGGVLFVPALAIFLDQSQVAAEATSLAAIVPLAVVGAWRQSRYGNVRLREGALIGAVSLPGVLVGVIVANAVSQRALELGFAGLILIVAAQLARGALAERPASGTGVASDADRARERP